MALCATQRHWLSLAGWLSWIVNIDRLSVERYPEQHNQLDLSLCCLGATCQARSALIMQLVSGVAGLSASSDISRGSVATHLRCGGICSDSFITNCLLILMVKEFWKSVNIWWSYEAYNKWCHFLAHPVYTAFSGHRSHVTVQTKTTKKTNEQTIHSAEYSSKKNNIWNNSNIVLAESWVFHARLKVTWNDQFNNTVIHKNRQRVTFINGIHCTFVHHVPKLVPPATVMWV